MEVYPYCESGMRCTKCWRDEGKRQGYASRKVDLMVSLTTLGMRFDSERFKELKKEFHKMVRDTPHESWGVMDSKQAPYFFYARAFIAGRNCGYYESLDRKYSWGEPE